MRTLDNIRQACRFVAENSDFVHIRHDRIERYAAKLVEIKPEKPLMDASCHYIGHGNDTVAFFVILDTINFGSGYFTYLKKRDGKSGYFTIATCLNDLFMRTPLKPQDIVNITPNLCCEIFDQDPKDRVVFELMRLFSRALNDLGNYVVNQYDSSFVKLIESAGQSSEKLVGILSVMPFFKDIADYKGRQIAFFKRAQILSMDLCTAFNAQGIGFFNDLHRLTIFADNLVPHVLRVDGILEYEESLSARIDRSEFIPSGSYEEIEIRACALDAVETISQILGGSSKGYTPAFIDNVLWNKGQHQFYKKFKPRHRTRSVYY